MKTVESRIEVPEEEPKIAQQPQEEIQQEVDVHEVKTVAHQDDHVMNDQEIVEENIMIKEPVPIQDVPDVEPLPGQDVGMPTEEPEGKENIPVSLLVMCMMFYYN